MNIAEVDVGTDAFAGLPGISLGQEGVPRLRVAFVEFAAGAQGPSHPYSSVSDQLWVAIKHDSIAAFAAKYPATLTPSAPG